jgi:hypothetical protein
MRALLTIVLLVMACAGTARVELSGADIIIAPGGERTTRIHAA